MIRQKWIKFGLKWIKKEKNVRREEEGDENKVADADEEEYKSWLHRLVDAQLPRNGDEAFDFHFYPKCKARTVGPHLLSKRIIDKKNFKKTNV